MNNKTQDKATARPWHISVKDGTWINGEKDEHVASTAASDLWYPTQLANAALIVQAVNKQSALKPQTVLWITAKCSDMFSMQMLPGLNSEPVAEYDGYVPLWFPNPNEEHYGDYVHLEIDLTTGQI